MVSQKSPRGAELPHQCPDPRSSLSNHLGEAKPQLDPDHCGAGPISKCLHLVPPPFMVDLGVVRIRTQWKLLGHLTLYFLCSKCLRSAPFLPTVKNFTFENRQKETCREGGEVPHSPTVLLGTLPINTIFPTVANLNFPSTIWWWGKYFSEESDFVFLHFQNVVLS